MARTNLLSAILGGVGGGVESGLAQRERSLAEEERRRAAEIAEQERQRVAAAATRAEARQGQLDIASLADRGYVTPEQQTQSMRRAAPGLQEALGVASGMMGQGPPRAMSEAGRRALESAAGQYGAPVAEVTVGGQTMRRMETPAQQALREANATSARTAREEDAKRRREAQAATAARTAQRDAYIRAGLSPEMADAAVAGDAKFADVFATPGVQATLQGQALSAMLARQRSDESDRDYQLRLREQERREADSASRMARLPVSVQTKVAAFNSGIDMARSAAEAVRANPNALGLKNLAPGMVTSRVDPAGVETRAMIEALTGEIRNQRFGGQLTASEAKLAEKFLPDAKDPPKAVLGKLRQLEAYLESKRKGLFEAYEVEYQPRFPSSGAPQTEARPPLSSFQR